MIHHKRMNQDFPRGPLGLLGVLSLGHCLSIRMVRLQEQGPEPNIHMVKLLGLKQHIHMSHPKHRQERFLRHLP